mgnify:CR=1 FL=1
MIVDGELGNGQGLQILRSCEPKRKVSPQETIREGRGWIVKPQKCPQTGDFLREAEIERAKQEQEEARINRLELEVKQLAQVAQEAPNADVCLGRIGALESETRVLRDTSIKN